MIELDVSAPWEVPDEPSIGRGSAPRWPIVGLLLVSVLLLTGGARVAGSYEPIYTVAGDASVTLLGGGRLFVIRDGGGATDPVSGLVSSRLVAYRIDDGAPLWSTDIGATGRDLLYADDRLVLTIDADTGTNQPTIAGRDAATGRLRWQRSGVAADQVIDGVLVGEAPESTGHHHVVYGIAVDTGETVWTIDSGEDVLLAYLYHQLDYVDGLYGLAQLDADRVVRVRDPRTGGVMRTVRLGDDGQAQPIDSFDIIDGMLITYLPDGTTTAFDAATGAYRWRLSGNNHEDFVVACGAVVCHGHAQTMTGLDPVTGRTMWTFDEWNWVSPLDDRHIVVNRLSGVDLQPLSGGAVFDVTTGRVTRQLGAWRAISTVDRRLLVWRPDPTSRNGDALVGILDPATGAVAVAAHTTGWYSQPHCHVAGHYLTCNDHLDIAVWRLR